MDTQEVRRFVKELLQRQHQGKHPNNISVNDFLDLNTKDEIQKRFQALVHKKYLDQATVKSYVDELKKEKNVKVYTPYKYFEGLRTKSQVRSRFLEILRGKTSDPKDPRSYQTFSTDPKVPQTTKSKYTLAFEKQYGTQSKSLEQKAQKTGIPLTILEAVFRKGKAAWRTGHRVGATEDQWGYARVHSFIMLGCTALGPDFSLLKKAIQDMKASDIRRWFSLPILCPENTLKKEYYEKFAAKQYILRK
ncbi:hypothetical protein EBR03_09500 [bacterium]|nr:hypothetical protein [bacterium]